MIRTEGWNGRCRQASAALLVVGLTLNFGLGCAETPAGVGAGGGGAAAVAEAPRSSQPAIAMASAEPKHLIEARALLKEIQSAGPDRNSYQHKNITVVWPAGPAGADRAVPSELHADCSGFLNLLVAHACGLSADQILKRFGRARPLAKTWYAMISAQFGFEEIRRVQDIRPGDFIAIQYPPGGENTGHCMLAAGVATQRKATKPLLADSTQWEVTVIDSSMSPHGSTDTRNRPAAGEAANAGATAAADKPAHATGLGQGILRLYADKDGKIVGYSWSVLGGSDLHLQADHALVVGRGLFDVLPKGTVPAAAGDEGAHD